MAEQSKVRTDGRLRPIDGLKLEIIGNADKPINLNRREAINKAKDLGGRLPTLEDLSMLNSEQAGALVNILESNEKVWFWLGDWPKALSDKETAEIIKELEGVLGRKIKIIASDSNFSVVYAVPNPIPDSIGIGGLEPFSKAPVLALVQDGVKSYADPKGQIQPKFPLQDVDPKRWTALKRDLGIGTGQEGVV